MNDFFSDTMEEVKEAAHKNVKFGVYDTSKELPKGKEVKGFLQEANKAGKDKEKAKEGFLKERTEEAESAFMSDQLFNENAKLQSSIHSTSEFINTLSARTKNPQMKGLLRKGKQAMAAAKKNKSDDPAKIRKERMGVMAVQNSLKGLMR